MQNAIGLFAFKRNYFSEDSIARLQAAWLYGVEAYLYNLDEVETYLEKGYINAYKWENGRLTECQVDLPLYTESRIRYTSEKEYSRVAWDFLIKNTVMISQYQLPKLRLHQLMACSELSEYSIPSFPISTYSDLKDTVKAIPRAVVKPTMGSQGRGLMLVERSGDTMTYAEKGKTGILTEDYFRDYYERVQHINHSTILVEPYINIKNDEGKAVDFRCLVSLNGKAEWENVMTIAKIGGSSMSSNVSNGGSLSFAEVVLDQMAPGQGMKKLKEMDQLALRVANFIQKVSEKPVSLLGIDICMERGTNQLYVIEANARPGTQIIGPWSLAPARAQYYKYLVSQNQA